MTNSCCQLPSLRMQYCIVFVFRSRQQWKYPHASFPLARKATGMSGSFFSPIAAMLHKSRSTEKGKIPCEFMGKRGKTSETAAPEPLRHHTGRGESWCLVTVISPPDGCNAHMELPELSFLKSPRKLIFMILMRDVAYSDQDLKLCSFSAGHLNIPPKRTTLLSAQALTRLTAAHTWKYPKESNQIFPFVQAGSGCTEILSEISVLRLLTQPSWADRPMELSITAPTKTQTHPTTPQCSRGKNVFIFTKS